MNDKLWSSAARLRTPLMIPAREWALRGIVFIAIGLAMNSLGHLLNIAWFKHWWQVGTCYLGYVLPIALLIRQQNIGRQIAWMALALIPLELIGYGIGSSVAAPGNLLEPLIGPRAFALVMAMVASPVGWIGNLLSARLLRRVETVEAAPAAT